MNRMDSVLYDAVTKDNVDALEGMETTPSVGDQLTPTKSTVLHLACQYGSFKCVQHILTAHQALLLKINSSGRTALHLAARQGDLGVVTALIDSAKSLDRQLRTSTVVRDLIRARDKDSETALHGAVRYNRKDVVALLVEEDPSHPHCQNKHDESALYLASIRYYTDIITIIFNNCRWPNSGDASGRKALHAMFGGPEGRTALHAAVLDHGGHKENKLAPHISACVKLLLERNTALVKKADVYGWTAFHYVAHNNLDNVVELLVDADRSAAYLEDNTHKRIALHVAAYRGNLQVMKKLVEYYPDSWEIVDGSGRNILHIAVEQDRKDVIGFILSRGFAASNDLLTKSDSEGNTPLHLITKLGCYVPELMHQKGHVLNFMNRRAVDWASEVDWEVLDNKKLTPLDVLHSEQESHTLADQVNVRSALIAAKVKKHWQLWRTLKEPDVESGKMVVRHSAQIDKEEIERFGKMINTHMIVAALIATVAFTAGFNLPDSISLKNKDTEEGVPILFRRFNNGTTIFQVFILSDALALFLSVTSLLYNLVATFLSDAGKVKRIVNYSAILNVGSIVAMVVSFITGVYALLADQTSPPVALTVVFTIAYLFLACGILIVRVFKDQQSKILLSSDK